MVGVTIPVEADADDPAAELDDEAEVASGVDDDVAVLVGAATEAGRLGDAGADDSTDDDGEAGGEPDGFSAMSGDEEHAADSITTAATNADVMYITGWLVVISRTPYRRRQAPV